MTAGLNIRIDVIKQSWTDDGLGGAVVTGTLTYQSIAARLDYFTPRWQQNQAGQETRKTYIFTIRPPTLVIEERDVLQVVFPPHHMDYGKRFVVRGLQRESIHPSDPRGFIELTCERIEESRGPDTN